MSIWVPYDQTQPGSFSMESSKLVDPGNDVEIVFSIKIKNLNFSEFVNLFALSIATANIGWLVLI